MSQELMLLRRLKMQLEEALCNASSMYIKGSCHELLDQRDVEELNETLEKIENSEEEVAT